MARQRCLGVAEDGCCIALPLATAIHPESDGGQLGGQWNRATE